LNQVSVIRITWGIDKELISALNSSHLLPSEVALEYKNLKLVLLIGEGVKLIDLTSSAVE